MESPTSGKAYGLEEHYDLYGGDQMRSTPNKRAAFYDPARDLDRDVAKNKTAIPGTPLSSDAGEIGPAHDSYSSPINMQPSRRGPRRNAAHRNDTRSDGSEEDVGEMEQLSDDNDEAIFLLENHSINSRASGRHPATRPARRPGYTVPGAQERLPSRNSGVVLANSKGPYVNKAPHLAPRKQASEASLLKRGLTKLGEATMARRASGANDPENITIVNLVDNHGKKWSEVADILNGARIAKGLQPSFTANSVHNRYNRNAPLLSAAEGKEFIPVCERNNKAPKAATSSNWTPELDKILVEKVQEVDKEKWPRVAQLFNQATGMNIKAEAIAYRNSLI